PADVHGGYAEGTAAGQTRETRRSVEERGDAGEGERSSSHQIGCEYDRGVSGEIQQSESEFPIHRERIRPGLVDGDPARHGGMETPGLQQTGYIHGARRYRGRGRMEAPWNLERAQGHGAISGGRAGA